MDVINTENVQRAFQSGSGKAIKLRGETLNAIELRKQKELAVAKIDPVVEEEQAEKSAPVVEETPVSEEITKELETEEKEEVDLPSEKPLYNNDTRNYRNTSLISYFDKLKSMAKSASSGINSSSIYEQVIEECISIERQMNEVKESIKLLPNERRNIYKSKNISDINIEKLIANKSLSDYLNKYIDFDIDFKIASNILLGDITSYLNKNNMSIYDTKLDKNFVNFVNMLSKGSISSKIFKDILEELLTSNLSVEEILKRLGKI